MNSPSDNLKPQNPDKVKIVFLGTPRLAQIVLENLASSPFKPQLVITGRDHKAGRGLALSTSLVKQEALKQCITVDYKFDRIDKSFDLAILVAFGQIIPKEILAKPKFGFLNVHPSLLPKYRGPSPIQTVILNGGKKTGTTIIRLDSQVDHGPILAQKEIGIEKEDAHDSLIEKVGLVSSNLLLETLPGYLSEKLKLKKQNDKQATFTKKITKKDGEINLKNPPSKQKLDVMIRAFYPWPTIWTKMNGKIIKFLPKGMIQPEGKKPMTKEEFLNGYPSYKLKIEKLIP